MINSNLNDYNNKYFMLGDDKYSLTYIFVKEANSFDYADTGDFLISPNKLDNYRTLVFHGVKIEIMGNSVYYEDGIFIERINEMTEVSWVDFDEALRKVKKSINNIGI